MADYFASDVHLRLDRPDRARRFAGLVDRLDPADRLIIVGDLCDFWFASRQRRSDPLRCEGLAALINFRDRGGRLEVLVGNHDAWLGPDYERWLGPVVLPEPYRLESYGLRLIAAHGHRVKKGKSPWKTAMEGRPFLQAFRMLPESIARGLEAALDRTNEAKKAEVHRRFLATYREEADNLAGHVDLVVFGHVHQALDDSPAIPRLVVLGDWVKSGSYLRIDEGGAVHRRLDELGRSE